MDWSSEISDGRTLLTRFDRALEIIFASTFSREIGFQFWINLLSLSFFSINLIVACLCELQSSPLSKECETQDENVYFTSDQSVSKNSSVRPSFPGDLLLGILFKASNSSFSVISFLHSTDCSVDSWGKLETVFKKLLMSCSDKCCLSIKRFLQYK